MKHFLIALFVVGLILLQFEVTFAADRPRRPKMPKECRVSQYTCILKKVDGVPFYCVRLTKQRYQNARKSIRVVPKRTCLRRYPVEYEDADSEPQTGE